MLAPELMIVAAAGEWVNARNLHKDWRDAMARHRKTEIAHGSKQDTFGMAGAFLVGMGGVHLCALNRLPNLPTTVYEDGYRELLARNPSGLNTIKPRPATKRRLTCWGK